MTIQSIQRDWGTNPSIVRIETDAPIEEIVLTDWLVTQQDSIYRANNGNFQWKIGDAVLISYPLDQDNPEDTQSKTLMYVFSDFRSLNPIAPIYPNLQNIVAHAGGGQTNASALNIGINVVQVVATSGDSVLLTVDVLPQTIIVVNRGASALNVFPRTGDSINDLAVNASISISSGSQLMFIGVTETNWITLQ